MADVRPGIIRAVPECKKVFPAVDTRSMAASVFPPATAAMVAAVVAGFQNGGMAVCCVG